MTWNDDHQWKLKEPLTPSKNHFTYKYVILNDSGKVAIWEAGIDRLADLDILPESEVKSDNEIKRLLIENVWEKILIKFTLYSPEDSSTDETLWLIQNGNKIPMTRTAREQGWLLDTYGEHVTPWECSLLISNADKSIFGKKNLSITYSY